MKQSLTILFVIFAGCSSSLPIPSEEDMLSFQEQKNSISIEELRFDRELYITKCSGCHSLYLPSSYSTYQWNTILPTMAIKSKITEQESERIKRYLTLYASKNEILE